MNDTNGLHKGNVALSSMWEQVFEGLFAGVQNILVTYSTTSNSLQDKNVPRKTRRSIAYIIFCMNVYKKEAKINGRKIVKIYGPVN